jgi:CTP:molybdopterin cytidylyltransferase MocA
MDSRRDEIVMAMDAIRQATHADQVISRAAIAELESQVGQVIAVTGSRDVQREGERLLARALGRLHHVDKTAEAPVQSGLRGAVQRFEHALQRLGFLAGKEESLERGGP